MRPEYPQPSPLKARGKMNFFMFFLQMLESWMCRYNVINVKCL